MKHYWVIKLLFVNQYKSYSVSTYSLPAYGKIAIMNQGYFFLICVGFQNVDVIFRRFNMDDWLILNQELARLIKELEACYDDEDYRSLADRIDEIRADLKALN